MSTITVTVLTTFTFRGRQVNPGERLEMSALDASVCGRRHEVSLTPQSAPASAETEPSGPHNEAVPRRRRRYGRRDMSAEPQ